MSSSGESKTTEQRTGKKFSGTSTESGKFREFFDKSTILRIGDKVPDFVAKSTMGDIRFHDYIKGSWTLFFSHVRAFSPVCTTELGQISNLKDSLRQREVKLLGLTVDDVEVHKKWLKEVSELYRCDIDYPVIGDKDRKVSMLYNMLDKTNIDDKGPLTSRFLYLINPNMEVQLILDYPSSIGRNFDEVLRVIDAFLLVDKHRVLIPSNWKYGEKVIVHPKVSDDEASKTFKGYTKVKEHRTVDMPALE